jgi:hypothetical protein
MAIYYNKTKVSASSGVREKESSVGKKLLDGVVEDGEVIDLKNLGITQLRPSAFYGFSDPSSSSAKVAQVLLPRSITDLPTNCFSYTSAVILSPSSYPQIKTVKSNCFYNNTAMSGEAFFPSCTSIGVSSFGGTSILSASFPLLEQISASSFISCRKMSSASFPLASTVSSYGFLSCTSLASISLPSVNSVDYYSFQNCTSLASIVLPSLTKAPSYAFASSSLAKIDISSPCAFYSYAFSKDTALTSLILRSSSALCTLGNVNAFNSTPVANDTTADTVGYIYVPSNLIDAYKTADNWSTFADHFRAIEDYPDICGE